MMLKFLMTAVIVVGALTILRLVSSATTTRVRRDRDEAKVAARRQSGSEDMSRCERCGAYYPPAERCNCTPPHAG